MVRRGSTVRVRQRASRMRSPHDGEGGGRRDAASAQLDDHALARQHGWELLGAGEIASTILQQLERMVGTSWFVVEEHEAPSPDRAAEGDGLVDARVSPADLRVVLL